MPFNVNKVLEGGLNSKELELLPLNQVYVLAPFAVNVKLSPAHNVDAPFIETIGKLKTLMAMVDGALVHPNDVLPVTTKLELLMGFTAHVAVKGPWFHEYEVAPIAVNVMVWPVHKAFVPLILTTGKVLTVTAKDAAAALIQPAVLVPFNV